LPHGRTQKAPKTSRTHHAPFQRTEVFKKRDNGTVRFTRTQCRQIHKNSPFIAESVVKQQQSTNIHDLTRAIKTKSKVILHGYRSANSDRQNDRIVEPFSFTTNFVSTWAYDIEADCCKTFKNTRITKVDVLNENWVHEIRHQEGFMDVFRISSDQQIPVKLKLSLRAGELLKEEYPLSEKFISPLDETNSVFEAPVCSLDGVARFVLGLCHEIEILKPEALKIFIKKRVRKIF
jgi:predicted DNA-binding transcriptional regulator YafY